LSGRSLSAPAVGRLRYRSSSGLTAVLQWGCGRLSKRVGPSRQVPVARRHCSPSWRPVRHRPDADVETLPPSLAGFPSQTNALGSVMRVCGAPSFRARQRLQAHRRQVLFGMGAPRCPNRPPQQWHCARYPMRNADWPRSAVDHHDESASLAAFHQVAQSATQRATRRRSASLKRCGDPVVARCGLTVGRGARPA
jgi:hypothetical protein